MSVHLVDCLLGDVIAKVATTTVLTSGADNKELAKPKVVEENKLVPRRVPTFGQINWPKEPTRLKSSSSPDGLFPIFEQVFFRILIVGLGKSLNIWPLHTSSPSMAGSLSEVNATTAENVENRPSENTIRSPHETTLTAEDVGYSYVSKIRPAEGYNSIRPAPNLGDSQRLSYGHHHMKVLPYSSVNDKSDLENFSGSKLISPSSTAVSLDYTQGTLYGDDLAGKSHTSTGDENKPREYHEISKVEVVSGPEEKDSPVHAANNAHIEAVEIFRLGSRLPVSKVRPYAPDSTSETQGMNCPVFGPKVQAALPPKRAKCSLDIPFSSAEPTLDSIVGPVSCRDDSFSTLGSHEGHHHSSPSPFHIEPRTSGDHSVDLSRSGDEGVNTSRRGSQVCDHNDPSGGKMFVEGDTILTEHTVSHLPKTSDTSAEKQSSFSVTQSEKSSTNAIELKRTLRVSAIPESMPRFLHAPIPVSKIRPAFQTESTNELQGQGHSSVPKVGPIMGDSEQYSQTGRSYFNTESDDRSQDGNKSAPTLGSNRSSGHTQAISSMFDYKRTTQWLKDVLRYPESYTPKYTKRPSQSNRMCSTSPEAKSVLSYVVSSKSQGRLSVPSEKQSPRFDRIGFKRAVSDLERLLNEALAITTQVVDNPVPSTQQNTYKQPSISLHSHHSRAIFASPSADGSGGDIEVVASEDDLIHGEAVKPSSMLRRSKFNEPVQSHLAENSTNHESSQDIGHVGGFKIPRRKSSKKLAALSAAQASTEGKPQTQAAKQNAVHYTMQFATNVSQPPKARGPGGTGNARSGHAGVPYGVRQPPATGEEILPERDIAGRPLHTDHGISLRRKSHVSLRGAQGFSLAKSHKRQPIARD